MAGPRRLDPSEAFHASVDWAGSYGATCEGTVDASLLARSFEVLSARLPLLRARLERDEEGFSFQIPRIARVDFSVRPGDESTYRQEMSRRLDSARGVARLALVQDRARSWVVLALHHAAADATAGLFVFTRLWETYTALSNGENVVTDPVTEPQPSAEQLLVARGAGGSWDGAAAAAVCRALAANEGAFELPAAAADRVRLDRAATGRLAATIARHDLTQHGLLCGLVLSACRDELRPEPGVVRLVCGSPVDCRSWISPPVEPYAATNFVVGIEFEAFVAGNSDPLAVARDASAELDKVMAAIEPERMLLDPQRFSGQAVEVVDYAVSSVGAIPPFATPDGITITDFRGYPSTAVPGLLLHLVTIYNGQLSVDVVSPDGMLSAGQRARLVERLRTTLGRLTHD